MYTCDVDTCDLSSDGLTVTLAVEGSVNNNTMYFAINVLHHWVVPQHDYTYYWLRNPAVVPCGEEGNDPLVFSGTIMPPWFYGTVVTEGSCNSSYVMLTAQLSSPVAKMEEVGEKSNHVHTHAITIYNDN